MAELSVLQRLKQGTATRNLRIAIAEGLIPLDGNDLVDALSILSQDPDTEVREILLESIPALPRSFLVQIVRQHQISSDFLDFLAKIFPDDDEMLSGIILNKNVSNETLVFVAERGPSPTLVLLSENKKKIIACPEILDKLLENEQLPRVNRYSLLEFKESWSDSIKRNFEAFEHKVDDSSSKESDTAVMEELISPLEEPHVEATLEEPSGGIELEIDPELELELEDLDIDEDDDFAGPSSGPTIEKKVIDPATLRDGWDIDDLISGVSIEEEKKDLGIDDDFLIDEEFPELEETGKQKEEDDWLDIDFSAEYGIEEDIEEDIDEDEEVEEKIHDTRMRMMKMGAAEKLILATMGTKQERLVLVRDSNKKVAVAVVQSPKMSEFEIKMIAGNRSVCEDVLREIYGHRQWGKSPSIRKELALNPKTPLALSLRILNNLNDIDLKEVAKSKEIPYGLTANAKRLINQREARRSKR